MYHRDESARIVVRAIGEREGGGRGQGKEGGRGREEEGKREGGERERGEGGSRSISLFHLLTAYWLSHPVLASPCH